ncbi:MAG: NlpC/P60 family protein [Kiloniellales bacterium]|nr:NlpC/P60 family protein [Kiloniellales bacterium]
MSDDQLSPRLNAYRPDLADARLEGRVEAAQFVAGRRRRVAVGVADLRREPEDRAALDSQLLFGETVLVFEERGGWSWVQNETDGYVGYAPSSALGDETAAAAHKLSAPRSFLYPEPDIKAPPLEVLSLGARAAVTGEDGAFSKVPGGFIYRKHLAPLTGTQPDYVETALSLLGVPYLWGGRSTIGLDCSALVQLVLDRSGIACLRDSGQQETTLGVARPLDQPPERGDIIYFPGHVAIALDAERVVHANAFDMLTAVEPLADVVERVVAEGGRGITSIRRPRA